MESKTSLPQLIGVIATLLGLIVLVSNLVNCYQQYGWKSWFFLASVIGGIVVFLLIMTLISVFITYIFSEIAPQLVTPEDIAYDENLVRSNRKRNNNFFDKISDYFSDNPPIVYFILTFLLVIIFYKIDENYFNEQFKYYDLLVEAHGLIFDALIFGLLLSFYEKLRVKKEDVSRNLERIEDYSGVYTLEAKQKIIMSLHRLSKYRIRQVYLKKIKLNKAELRKVYLSEGVIVDSNFENAELQNSNLDNSFLFDTKFNKVKSNYSNVREAILVNVNLNEADLEKVNFTNSIFINCDIKFNNINEMILDNVIIDNKLIFQILLDSNCVGVDSLTNRYEIKEYDKYTLSERCNEATKWLKDANIKHEIKEKLNDIILNKNKEFYIIKRKE